MLVDSNALLMIVFFFVIFALMASLSLNLFIQIEACVRVLWCDKIVMGTDKIVAYKGEYSDVQMKSISSWFADDIRHCQNAIRSILAMAKMTTQWQRIHEQQHTCDRRPSLMRIHQPTWCDLIINNARRNQNIVPFARMQWGISCTLFSRQLFNIFQFSFSTRLQWRLK